MNHSCVVNDGGSANDLVARSNSRFLLEAHGHQASECR